MAQTVGTLLTKAFDTAGLIGKVQRSPTAQTAGKMAQAGASDMKSVPGLGPLKSLGDVGKIFKNNPVDKFISSGSKLFKSAIGLPGKLVGKAMGTLGISLSLSTLLRQSQIFTGTLGALFQVLGGFVDVLLAPFMPLFAKVIRKLAQQIPAIRAWAQKAYVWLENKFFPIVRKAASWIWSKFLDVVNWITENGPEIQEKVGQIWDVINTVFEKTKEIIVAVWGWAKEHIWPFLKATGELIWEMMKSTWEWLSGEAWPVLKVVFERLRNIVEGILTWLREDIYPLIQDFWDWFLKEIGGFVLWLADNVSAWLEKVVPIVQDILTQVLDILINSILKPMWEALEPIIKTQIKIFLDNWEWFLGVIRDKILPFVKDVLDDLMPRIQRLSDFWMEHLAPVVEDIYATAREFIDAFLDLALPVIKFLLKILWIVAEPILKGLMLIVKYLWYWIIKPIMKTLIWLMRLPYTWKEAIVDPIVGAFDWLKDKFSDITFFFKNIHKIAAVAIIEGIAGMLKKFEGRKIDLPFAKDIQLGWLADMGRKLEGTVSGMATGLENERLQRKYAAMGSNSMGGLYDVTGGAMNVTINNISERGVIDDSKNFVVDSAAEREINNRQMTDAEFGFYGRQVTDLAG